MDVLDIIGKGLKYPFRNVKFSILFLVTSFILGIFNYLVNNNLLNDKLIWDYNNCYSYNIPIPKMKLIIIYRRRNNQWNLEQL